MSTLGAIANAFAALGPPIVPVAKPPTLPDEGPGFLMPIVAALVPAVAYLAMAPVLWLFFHRTWRELDVAAHEHQRKTLSEGGFDRRPAVLFVITALVLTIQYYDATFYTDHVRPWLRYQETLEILFPGKTFGRFVHLRKYDELYSYAWWSFNRVFGYTVVPLGLWKVFFPKDSLLDMGLRGRGFLSHAWIYGLCLVVVLPLVFVVSGQPDFNGYYPFYKQSARSWMDLAIWEAMYFAQFFALEIFFRGFWLNGLRSTLGSGAIFAMCVPYCMIHYGKPYLEACGAVIAGIALGSLSMRTKSIYSGFLVHITVALSMDFLALYHRHAMPTQLWGPN